MQATHTRLLDIEEAAWYLDMTPRWVRSKWATKELPGIKFGRAVRFRIEDLDAYVAERRVESPR